MTLVIRLGSESERDLSAPRQRSIAGSPEAGLSRVPTEVGMKNKDVLKALEAAFTGYERNNNAALLELLSDDFTFEMSDSLPYGGTYVGRPNSSDFGRRSRKIGPIFVTMRERSSMRATLWSYR
jgi:hypothetical protein